MTRTPSARTLTLAFATFVAFAAAGAALPSAATAQTAGDDPLAQHFEDSFAAEAKGDYATALNEILTALRMAPKDYVATLRAGWLHYLKQQYEDSVVMYRKAMALAPKAIEPALGLALPLAALGRWKETAEVCKDVLKTAPNDYTALSRLAWAQYNLGDYKAAVKSYGKLHALYPSDVEMMLGLGWAHTKLGDKTEARKMFTRVLQLRSISVRARAGLEACCP